MAHCRGGDDAPATDTAGPARRIVRRGLYGSLVMPWDDDSALAWVSPQWLDVDLSDGTSRTYTVDEDTLSQHHLRFEPPMRRWAARRALRADPERLDDLLSAAGAFEPRHRDALIHGLLDAADVLEAAERRRVVRRGLQTAQASVRRTALGRLCELDGPEKAVRRARSDPNATVRARSIGAAKPLRRTRSATSSSEPAPAPANVNTGFEGGGSVCVHFVDLAARARAIVTKCTLCSMFRPSGSRSGAQMDEMHAPGPPP
jgi:hypothetical protein